MRSFFCRHAFKLGFFLSLCFQAPALHAQESYYVILFAYEGTPRLPRSAHTFATFIKAADAEKGAKPKLEISTISWLSTRSNTRLLLLKAPDPGVNHDLVTTLQIAASLNAQVSAWGPYRIPKELYDRGIAQIARLKSGAVAYKATDAKLRQNGAINCIHAVSEVVPGPPLDTGTAFGVPATEMVRAHMAPRFLDEGRAHLALLEPLNLKDYPIVFRDQKSPPNILLNKK